jgi:VanZ family protein
MPVRTVGRYAWLVLIGLCYAYGLATIAYPEEKIHFIEYGILAFLIYRAMRLSLARPGAYIGAFFLTGISGWVDEGIQHLLPNRYYQLEDVLLNAVSGALGLALLFLFERRSA